MTQAVATTMYIDATAGAAGDMLLAALVDAGADSALVLASIERVLPGARVSFDEVTRAGLRARRATVAAPETSPHRRWRDLRTAISTADLPPRIGQGVLAVFGRLADAEAAVHGIDPDDVHFHEVGAWDSVCDVVGCVAAIESLSPARIACSAVATGSGTVVGEHGTMPVPAPATAELLARRQVPTIPGPAPFEACTPTAAALLCHFVDDWVAGPAMIIHRVGVGAGTADPGPYANVTRVFVGRGSADDGSLPELTAVVLETNVDDIDPRLWPGIQRDLLARGASDCWLTPIHMKKGRPAMTLSVLCGASMHRQLAGAIMELTPAIGMRVIPVGKVAAERAIVQVHVNGHPVRVKVASWQDQVVNVQPEWDDVAAVAAATGEPAKVVLALAQAAAADLWPDRSNQ